MHPGDLVSRRSSVDLRVNVRFVAGTILPHDNDGRLWADCVSEEIDDCPAAGQGVGQDQMPDAQPNQDAVFAEVRTDRTDYGPVGNPAEARGVCRGPVHSLSKPGVTTHSISQRLSLVRSRQTMPAF